MLNHFSIMQQRRLRDQDEEEEDKDKGRKAPGKGGGLRIHDLEEDLELSSEESEGSEAEGERGNPKIPQNPPQSAPKSCSHLSKIPPKSTQSPVQEKTRPRVRREAPKST